MSHSSTLTHFAWSIATFCIPRFDCIVKHCLWWHCDNTSSLFYPCRESLESPDCLGIPADKDPRCVMNSITQLFTREKKPHRLQLTSLASWLAWEEFDHRPTHDFEFRQKTVQLEGAIELTNFCPCNSEDRHEAELQDLCFFIKKQLVRTSLPQALEDAVDIECHELYETLHAKVSWHIQKEQIHSNRGSHPVPQHACYRAAHASTSGFPVVILIKTKQ